MTVNATAKATPITCSAIVIDETDLRFHKTILSSSVTNTECPACMEPMADMPVTVYACRLHAACTACAALMSHCPLCRAPGVVPIQIRIAVLDRAPEVTYPNLRAIVRDVQRSFGRVRIARSLPEDDEAALRRLCVYIERPYVEWSYKDLWTMKRETRILNRLGVGRDPTLEGWSKFISACSAHRATVLYALGSHFEFETIETRLRS